ncbi:non-ribosomal peptide synthetase [Kitasatospora sp. NPDC093550]|uniref:non-ribosomal peptide synthetase n=1 Tax=Kitasatospora sp. NPDC093550 TaxID=3364089 RepID=UPI00382586DB
MEAEPMDSRTVAAPGTEQPGTGECVSRLFEQRVRANPDGVAVSDAAGAVTYARLNADANRLADLLVERGAAAEAVVAISLPRGRALVTAVLAVLKSGAGYLPLDPALPAQRRAELLAAAGARLLIGTGTEDGVETVDPAAPELAARPDQDRPQAPALGDLAYVIFTSGSTGRPKPVAVTHGSLAHHARAIRDAFGLTPADRVLQFANPGFDVLGEELYPALVTGAGVAVAPAPVPPPVELEEFLREQAVTLANLPTPYWDQWARDLDAQPRPLPAALRLLVVGSDTAYTHTLAAWRRHGTVPVVNAYGLTETTITATLHHLADRPLPGTDTLPIGRPLPGVEAHLLDADLAPVPAGEPGELYLGGALLARGYLGRPEQTAERFVPDPFGGRPGARLYRTGDLARFGADGELLFLGRSDDQVKIRGQRVEPTEVSAALLTHPAVRQAHVRAVRDDGGDTRLVAYAALGSQPATVAELRGHLAARLLPAMVPASYVLLDELPLTANGKIDQRALPVPAPADTSAPPAVGAPAAGLEGRIAAIWCEVLKTDRVGLDDSFFEIGGHSLLLVQVQRKLSAELGRPVNGVELFAHPTVRTLAAHLTGREAGDGSGDVPGAGPGGGPGAGSGSGSGERADARRAAGTRLQQRRAARQTAGGAR